MKNRTAAPSTRRRSNHAGRGRRRSREPQREEIQGRTSPRPATKAVPHQIIILKSDRLYGDLICRQIKTLCADVHVEVFQRGVDALAAIKRSAPDLFISGIKIEDMDGVEHLERASEWGLAILIVTSRCDTHTFHLLQRVRFDGLYDGRTEGLRHLETAVERAIARERYVSPTFVPHLKTSKNPKLETLTEKEKIVLSVLGDGSDDQEAARRLGLSPHTVNTHRKAIMAKCRLHHKGQLIRYALREGYVHVGPRGVSHPGFQRKIRAIGTEAPFPEQAPASAKLGISSQRKDIIESQDLDQSPTRT
jgi:DNA-binding NarL/FixJ family response regulator